MIPTAVLVAAGGALGAVGRFVVGDLLENRELAEHLPASTLAVNAVGTFLLGVLTFGGAGSEAMTLLGTGACGAFTTFSSFSVQTVERWEDGERAVAAGYALGTLVVAGAALGVAWLLVG